MSDPRVGVLNLRMGNLRSVSNAVYQLGFDPELVARPEELRELSHLIVPGVGAFQAAADRLAESGLDEAVREFVASGRPVLGLCLGMQLLASRGEEGRPRAGLDLIPGEVKRLDPERAPAIPHMGWNAMELAREHPVVERVSSGVDFYFVHSYHFVPEDPAHVLGRTEYGEEFVSAVARDNVVGFQFHPEKSQRNGLQVIDNFCMWNGQC